MLFETFRLIHSYFSTIAAKSFVWTFNSFFPNASFLYPLKTENLKVGNEWVNKRRRTQVSNFKELTQYKKVREDKFHAHLPNFSMRILIFNIHSMLLPYFVLEFKVHALKRAIITNFVSRVLKWAFNWIKFSRMWYFYEGMTNPNVGRCLRESEPKSSNYVMWQPFLEDRLLLGRGVGIAQEKGSGIFLVNEYIK